ncbi:hypothetical protein [Nostoc sp.]|uniref:hypothetical protein n=1 Tax=Nostoc sp. TaxID=1180 RepID=UPI002FF6E0A4
MNHELLNSALPIDIPGCKWQARNEVRSAGGEENGTRWLRPPQALQKWGNHREAVSPELAQP